MRFHKHTNDKMTTENITSKKKVPFLQKALGKVFDFFTDLLFVNRIPLAIIIMLVMLVLFGIIFVIVGNASDINLQITNFAFAILLGLSSVCFSWVRTFESLEDKTAISIRQSGELSLFAAILFLLASFLNYLQQLLISSKNPSAFSPVIAPVIKCTVLIIFLGAVLIFLKVLSRLLLVLRKRYRDIGDKLVDPDVY